MKQANNDQIIISKIIEKRRTEAEAGLSESQFFERFVCSEILKDRDLSLEEIESGLVDGGNDGGIDGIYVFYNGELVREDSDIHPGKKHSSFDIIIIQSKHTGSFSEVALDKLISSVGELFNLASDLNEFALRYNQDLLNAVDVFRKIHNRVLLSFPNIHFKFYYSTLGSSVHPNVEAKVPRLKSTVADLFSDASIEFSFCGAKELLSLTRTEPQTSFELSFVENPILTERGSYVCLIPLVNFYRFIVDDKGKLIRRIFDANVRDYQGSVRVNSAIQATLASPGSEDFWFLNNGITVLTPRASTSGKKLIIESPQIVNGLQTSHEIYTHFSAKGSLEADDRKLLIRIVVEDREECKDNIVKATNSQTSIPSASLRAADKIQRDIEDYFLTEGFFYERRKNYYKNNGKPTSEIVSISYLSQVIITCVLLKPDFARARPSTLVNDDNDYATIFDSARPMSSYLNVVRLGKRIDNYLRTSPACQDMLRRDVNNIRFHLLMLVMLKKLQRSTRPSDYQLSELKVDSINTEDLNDCLKVLLSIYNNGGASDQFSKSREFVEKIIHNIKSELEPTFEF